MRRYFAAMIAMAAWLSLVGSTATTLHESMTVRKFSLVTATGKNVLHQNFDRRRLADGLDSLSLSFHAANRNVSKLAYSCS